MRSPRINQVRLQTSPSPGMSFTRLRTTAGVRSCRGPLWTWLWASYIPAHRASAVWLPTDSAPEALPAAAWQDGDRYAAKRLRRRGFADAVNWNDPPRPRNRLLGRLKYAEAAAADRSDLETTRFGRLVLPAAGFPSVQVLPSCWASYRCLLRIYTPCIHSRM